MSKSKRRSRIINSSIQRAVLFKFVIHWAFAIVAIFAISFTLHLMFKSPEESYASILGDMKNRYALSLFVLFALVPYFLRDLIELTHRVVGPMKRFEDALKKAARGESIEPLSFRDGDYWQELAADFNRLVERGVANSGREPSDPQAPQTAVSNDEAAADSADNPQSEEQPELVGAT